VVIGADAIALNRRIGSLRFADKPPIRCFIEPEGLDDHTNLVVRTVILHLYPSVQLDTDASIVGILERVESSSLVYRELNRLT